MNSEKFHPLLRRQIKRLKLENQESVRVNEFIRLVSDSYFQFDSDRLLLERAMDLSAEEVNLSKEKAEEGARAKSKFLANMSHEIRTPMNGILGMAELLLESNLNDEQKDLANTIRDSGECLLAIVNDILDFSKIEAGKIELIPEPFELYTCLERCKRLFQKRLELGVIAFIIEVHRNIPEKLIGDSGRLSQILINLIGNSVKFTPSGGAIMLLVEPIDLRDDKITLNFHVSDTGIGIHPEDQQHIFDAFSQAARTDMRKYGGTGLGLTISTQLVKLMGGEIALTSVPGKGTRFSFSASFAPSFEKQKKQEQAPNEVLSDSNLTIGQLNILAAEDNSVNQLLIKRFLGNRGHKVTVAQNGKEVIELFSNANFDLILMDIQMPEIDGIAATKEIRAMQDPSKAKIPIIALTANALVGDREHYISQGMDNYIAKPFNADSLMSVISHTIVRHTSASEEV